jgi:hypothetical protein
MEVEGKAAPGAVVDGDFIKELGPGEDLGEFGGRGITGIARPGHIVLPDQVQIDVESAHLKSIQRYSIQMTTTRREGF